MSLTTKTNSTVAQLNAANPNTLADNARTIGLGTVVRQLRVALRRQSPAAAPANPYNLSTLQVIPLPDDAKAFGINRAYARGGTGALGEMTVKPPSPTVAAGYVSVAPNGDLVFLATDSYNDVDIDYEPAKQDVKEITVPIPSGGLVTFGTTLAGVAGSGTSVGVLMLMEAEILNGTIATAIAKKVVLLPGATVATGQAALNTAKTAVQFSQGDLGTQARLKLGICSAIDVNAVLEAASAQY